MTLQTDPIQIFYPNGGNQAVQMYIWDGLKPILWDGSVTASITVGGVTGTRTNNTAIPGATNLGVLAGIATAVAPTYTEGFLVGLSTDLSGALRVAATISTAGLATEAKQDSEITQLTNINTKLAGNLTVIATNLDIRDLVFATDKVDASGSTGVGVTGTFFQATQPVSIASTITVQATNLDIRDLTFAADKVDASGSTGLILGAGTAAFGKLSANSGVDIGDVDVTSIAAGTNTIGAVNVKPTTAGGLLIAQMTSADGSTALTATAQAIKASAGQLFGWYIYNPNATAIYVPIYNTAAGSVTVGTTNPAMTLCIPATSAANVEFTNGIEFTNAGWAAAATTTGGGNTAPGTALEANFFYK